MVEELPIIQVKGWLAYMLYKGTLKKKSDDEDYNNNCTSKSVMFTFRKEIVHPGRVCLKSNCTDHQCFNCKIAFVML